MENFLKFYFEEGYEYEKIKDLLNTNHGITISFRTLKRKIKELGFKRFHQYTQDYVNNIVYRIIDGPASSLGYRLLRKRILTEYGLLFTQEQVRLALSVLDPEGVALRQQRRLNRRTYFVEMPNVAHHVDGYDKLKPFGFSIYGTIDGFSRYVTQLSVMVSNKNPAAVAHAFLDGVMENQGLPTRTVSDYGTETGLIAGIMNTFAGPDSHKFTSSQRNQRIESWWSQLRRGGTTYIINYLGLLESEGLVNYGDPYDVDLLRYCFMPALQNELNMFRSTWNQHVIRSQRYSQVPSGVPSDLHFNAVHDAKIVVPSDVLLNIRRGLPERNLSRTGVHAKDKALFDISQHHGLNVNTKSLHEATELYLKLKEHDRIF